MSAPAASSRYSVPQIGMYSPPPPPPRGLSMPSPPPPPPPPRTLTQKLVAAPGQAYGAAVRGTWFEKNGKTVLVGAAVVGGIAVAGVVVYTIYQVLVGGGPPANQQGCATLTSLVNSIATDIGKVNAAIIQQTGAVTAAQQSQLNTLNQELANAIAQQGPACYAANPSVASSFEQFVAQTLGYAKWIALGIVLVLISPLAAASLQKAYAAAFGSSKTNPGAPPESIADMDVAAGADLGAADVFMVQEAIVAQYQAGDISISEAVTALDALATQAGGLIDSSGQVAFWESVISEYGADSELGSAAGSQISELSSSDEDAATAIEDALEGLGFA